MDVFDPAESDGHFDNCAFAEGVARINTLYEEVLTKIVADPMLAAKRFGNLLHTAQDFYAHSNWVDIGRTRLVEGTQGFWSAGAAEFSGIFSGTVGYGTPQLCPSGTPSHTDLNKDLPSRPLFQKAVTLAFKQTRHEWCRLLSLAFTTFTRAEVETFAQSWATDKDVALAACPGVDVALVIDSSGSMGGNDPSNLRLAASKAYLTASLPGDAVAVIDFDSGSRLASPALVLPENKNALSAAIDTIDSSGGTNIGAGVQTGCDALIARSPGNVGKAAILLTDGFGSFSGQDACFTDRGWRIFAFGFGNPDDALLTRIAANTGGDYNRLPTSNLVCEFQKVRAKIGGGTPGPCSSVLVGPGATVSATAAVAVGQAQATFSTSWPGSDVQLTLRAPSGRVIERTTVADDIVHDLGPTFETYSITNPEAGIWEVTLFGLDVPAEGEEVTFSVTTLPALQFPPAALCQSEVTVSAGDGCRGAGSIDGGSFSPSARPMSMVQSPAGPYALGKTPVTLTVTDDQGGANSCQGVVNVVDTAPPTIQTAPMTELWPPNHSYATYRLGQCATILPDNCGGGTNIDSIAKIVSIRSDESEDASGGGDGNTSKDIVILSQSSFQLRRERQGAGNGRVYTVTFDVPDAAGNIARSSCSFGVPKTQNGPNAVNDGPASGYEVLGSRVNTACGTKRR